MECQKCGKEISSGKRYCPYCGGENIYDGRRRVVESKPSKWKTFLKVILDPMWIFVVLCLIVVAAAYAMQ